MERASLGLVFDSPMATLALMLMRMPQTPGCNGMNICGQFTVAKLR
jgi:hypothetical protein